jgi:hypothetical protein
VRSKEEANAIADALLKPGVERRKKSRVRYPELLVFPIEQRDDVLRAAIRVARSGWQIPAALTAVVLLGVLAVAAALVRPQLAVSLVLATSVGAMGVARFRDVRTRKTLQLMRPADRTSE